MIQLACSPALSLYPRRSSFNCTSSPPHTPFSSFVFFFPSLNLHLSCSLSLNPSPSLLQDASNLSCIEPGDCQSYLRPYPPVDQPFACQCWVSQSFASRRQDQLIFPKQLSLQLNTIPAKTGARHYQPSVSLGSFRSSRLERSASALRFESACTFYRFDFSY